MTAVNVDLLRKVLTYITEHPEEWEQANWAVRTDCGTACCVAGHAVAMSGYKFRWSSSWSTVPSVAFSVFDADGRVGYIADVAAELLGLDWRDIDQYENGVYLLFDVHNTLDDLWRIAGELTDGQIQRPAVTS